MEEIVTFCEECRNYETFEIEEKEMVGILRGTEYVYMGKKALCCKCHSEVYVGEINDYNLNKLYSVYREKNNIISLEKILEIPEKYDIGKRPLSLLLGWGEQTFTRYCDGDMPTKQYSDILNKIYESPKYYEEILDKNKGNLVSEKTYEKSKKAVQKLLSNFYNFNSKINMVVKYILNKNEDITPLSLQKALYYIQGFYYAFYKKFLFDEECEAWVHGPVYYDIYAKYKNYKYDPIIEKENFDESIFSSSEKIIIDSIIKYMCCYSGKILEKFTHTEEPWLLTRGDILEYEPSNKIISKQIIGDYFTRVKEKYNMVTPTDIKEYSRNMFEKLN